MPTIESKKYENTQYISPKGWDEMKEKGIARRFKVIDDSDLQDAIKGSKNIQLSEVINNLSPSETLKSELSERDEIKAALDEKGVEYNTRASTENLKKLL